MHEVQKASLHTQLVTHANNYYSNTLALNIIGGGPELMISEYILIINGYQTP